jgi:DNA-binding transcriptional ArsR family regulator
MSIRSDVRAQTARRSDVPTPLVAPVAEACDVFHIDPAKVARLREALIGQGSVDALAETFRALGDPTRVRVLDALSHGELCVCDLAALLGLSQSATSHQLRLLRTLRLVRTRRAGRMVFYALDDRHIVTLFRQGLRHVEESEARPGRRLA